MENITVSISILLADDHTILRQGLRVLLESEPDFVVLGEAQNGLETLEQTRLLNPDVVILDLGLPDIHGLEVIRQIHQFAPNIRIVILSMHAKEAYIVEAFNNGASSYVLKGSKSSALAEAIRLSIHGIRYLSPPLSEEALQEYIRRTKDQKLDLFRILTNRERQILHLVASGYSNNEIALHLSISPRTVEVHRSKMMSKLSLHNQSELVRYAIQQGVIPLSEE